MASAAAGTATQQSVAHQRPALGSTSSPRGLPCRFSRTTARVALPSRQPAFSFSHKRCKAVRFTAAATPSAAANTADDTQAPNEPSTLVKLLSGLRNAAAVAAFAFMASHILTGPGAVLVAYYALQVIAPALALRKAFRLSRLEALIGSLTLVRIAWMLATRYILPPSALIKTHVTFTSSAVLPAFLQRYLNDGFYAPGYQPFGIEQIPLVDGVVAGLQAGLGSLAHNIVPALKALLTTVVVFAWVFTVVPYAVGLWERLTGRHLDHDSGTQMEQEAKPVLQTEEQKGPESGERSAVGQLEQSLLERDEMVQRLEEEVQRLKDALKSKRRESLRCAALEREVSHDKKTEQRKLTKLHEEIQQLTADNGDFAARLGEAQQEVAHWKEQAEKAGRVMEWAERRMRIEEDATIKLLRAEVNKLKHSVNVEEEEVELLGAELERAQATLKEEKAAVAQLSAELQQAKSSAEEMAGEMERLYKEQDLVQSAHDKELEGQRQAVNMLVAEKEQLVCKAAELREWSWNLEDKLTAKDAQLLQLQKQLEEIQAGMAGGQETADDFAQPAIEVTTKSEETPQDTLESEPPVALVGELVLPEASAPEETAPDSSQQVAGLVDFVGRVEGMDFVVLDAPKDESVAAEGSEATAEELKVESKDDAAVDGRGAYLRAEGYGFPELAREWDVVVESADAQVEEAARAELEAVLAPEEPAIAEEQVIVAAKEPKDDTVQSFAVDVESDGEYMDEEVAVNLEPGFTAQPALNQDESEQETFTVGIEMADEDAPEQPVKVAVDQSVTDAAAGKEQGADAAVASAAAETRRQFLQTMRSFRDAKEQQAKMQQAKEQQTMRGFKDAELQHANGPIETMAEDEAAEEPYAQQVVTEGDNSFAVEIDVEENGKPNEAAKEDFEVQVTDSCIDAVDVDVELDKEMPTKRDYDEQDWADQVEYRPGSYRFVNKNRKSKGKKRNR